MNVNSFIGKLISSILLLTAGACHNIKDLDDDGYATADGDCNDNDAAVHPNAPEIPVDGIDQNCNGHGDEDLDGDGFSADNVTGRGPDCNDNDPHVHPEANEISDGFDQNCNGIVDEDTESSDDDNDGYSESQGDCRDDESLVYPGATELDNNIDDNCNGIVDEATSGFDDDGDGYSEQMGDCDDNNPGIHPFQGEAINQIDDDCDGLVDDGTEVYDDDGDAWTEAQGDCNDLNQTVFPTAQELADGLDNDCDSIVDEGTVVYDDDGDGFSEDGSIGSAPDCDDADPNTYPGAPEIYWDSIDSDCDGIVETSAIQDPDLAVNDLVRSAGSSPNGDIDAPECEDHSTLPNQVPFVPPRNYFVTFYDIRNSDQTGGTMSIDSFVASQVDRLNDYFDPMGMTFSTSGTSPTIDDSALQSINDVGELEALVDSIPADGAIHIFIVGFIYGPAAGRAYFPDDAADRHSIVIDRDSGNVTNGTTIVHEMGHIFGLWHTHRGLVDQGPVELSDGSNCATAGDVLCDTPADPGDDTCCPQGNCALSCQPMCNGAGDAVGVYAPDVGNIMSYYPDACNDPSFSDEQQQRILCAARLSTALAQFHETVCNGVLCNVPGYHCSYVCPIGLCVPNSHCISDTGQLCDSIVCPPGTSSIMTCAKKTMSNHYGCVDNYCACELLP